MSSANWTNLLNWKSMRQVCAQDGCNCTSLVHSLTGRKSGMLLAGRWYCSAPCISRSVVERIRELREAASHGPASSGGRMPLELLLQARGLINHSQVRTARQRQELCGGTMTDILRDLQFATDRQLTDAVAAQWGCPVFAVRSESCEVTVPIPASLMSLVAMAPVHYLAPCRKLLVGFVQGIEHRILGTLEEMTDCVTEPCFITARECEQIARRSSGRSLEVVFERISSELEMAQVIRSYADQIGAEEVRLGICRDRLWARLFREGLPTDLLFTLSEGPFDQLNTLTMER